MTKRVLVITSCTGEKKYSPDTQLVQDDFQDAATLSKREEELSAYQTTAGQMYTGRQHLALMNGVEMYRQSGHANAIDVMILSAGYGMLEEETPIVPYEVTFNTMKSKELLEWSAHLQITSTLQEKIKEYDLIFFLLGNKYMKAVQWPIQVRDDQKLIFFASESSLSLLERQPQHYMLISGKEEAKRFHSGLIEIKGFLFAKLLEYFIEHLEVSWDVLDQQPQLVRAFILQTLSKQAELFEMENENDWLPFYDSQFPSAYKPRKPVIKKKVELPMESNIIARNYGTELNFYLPENDDRVDPKYDFQTDTHWAKRVPLTEDFYAHQFYDSPSYDGILISKVNVDKAAKKKLELISQMGIRKFLHLPEDFPILGDCGAFSYINDVVPPYTTEEVLDYYENLGFNFGVSIDHLIVGGIKKDEIERQRRYDLTLRNAHEFITRHHERDCSFTPIGVAQGWDPVSFREAVQQLINMGYNYVALGGLAKEKSTVIYEILKEIAPIIPNANFRMHLFGVFRDEEVILKFHKLGVTSFDSASPLRRAWMDARHNYYTNEGDTYTAIRIPEAKESRGRVKKILAEQGGNFEDFKTMENKALTAIRSYDAGELDIDSTLEAILEYDQVLGGNRSRHPEAYRRLLEEKPWRSCGCTICEKIGIDVVIFRGNNRNRRRGFHNTHTYYKRLKELKKQIFQPTT